MKNHIKLFWILLVCWWGINGCQLGSYSDAKGLCQQCDISCNSCRSSDGCNTCYDQMYLIARGNIVICDLCYNVLRGCDICITATKCKSCSSGYFLQSDNTCTNCSSLFPRCLLCITGNQTRCVSCQSPYKLTSGECKLSSNSSNPQQNQTSPTPKPNLNQKNGSSNQTPATTITCDPSQININGVCYMAIAFCESYNDNGSCLSCSSVFVLSNGYCLPSSLISNPSAQSQEPPQSSNTISSPCTSRQFFSDGVCHDVGPQCTQFNSFTGQCYLCASGFEILSGLCVQQVNSSGQSLTVNPVQNSVELPAHCQKAKLSDITLCEVCLDGYTTVDAFPGVCYPVN